MSRIGLKGYITKTKRTDSEVIGKLRQFMAHWTRFSNVKRRPEEYDQYTKG